MQIIDISRELFSTPAYPGDPAPYREAIRRMELGDGYNLTAFFQAATAQPTSMPRGIFSATAKRLISCRWPPSTAPAPSSLPRA